MIFILLRIFHSAQSKIVSGSYDRKIMISKCEASESAVQVLEGHEHREMVATIDGEQIFSSSFDGARL